MIRYKWTGFNSFSRKEKKMRNKIIRAHEGFGEDSTVINAVVETFDGKGDSRLESVRYFRPEKKLEGPSFKKKRLLTPEDWKSSQK